MRILFLTYNLSGGGAERVCASLCDHWMAKGNQVQILFTSIPNKQAYTTEASIVSPFSKKTSFFRKKRVLLAEARRFKPDIIVSFLFGPSFWANALSKKLGIPFVCSERNDPSRLPAGFLKQRIRNRIYKNASMVVCQTDDAAHYVKNVIGGKNLVIYNPLREMPIVSPSKEKPWVCLGRLEPQKNYPLLIDAYHRLCQEGRPVSPLHIYGEGSLRPALQAQIDKLELHERVFLKGWGRAEDALADAKGFVLSSDYEGMPNALGEALASGLPCVSTDCPIGGPKVFAMHAKGLKLVPVGNQEALCAALMAVEDDYENAVKASKEDRIAMRNAFSPERISEQWLLLLNQIIQGGLSK